MLTYCPQGGTLSLPEWRGGGVQGNSTRLANFDKNYILGLDLTSKGAEGRYDQALHFPFGQSFCQIPHSTDSRGGDLLD